MELLDLNQSEYAVLQMLCEGLLIKQVADRRGTAIKTVETQIRNAKTKNHAKTIHQLCAKFAVSQFAQGFQDSRKTSGQEALRRNKTSAAHQSRPC